VTTITPLYSTSYPGPSSQLKFPSSEEIHNVDQERAFTHSKPFKEVGHSINGDHLSHQSDDVSVRKAQHMVISRKKRRM
jgi:hypothetical protein